MMEEDTLYIHEKYVEMIYQMIVLQNKRLLREIALRENISVRELYACFLPNRKHWREFMKRYVSGLR